mgnify:FL=1
MDLVVVKDSSGDEILSYKKKLSQLKKRSADLQKSVDEKVEAIINENFKELSDEIKSLDAEIRIEESLRGIWEDATEEVLSEVSDQEIKSAFHKIAKYTHPDKVGDEYIEEFKDAQEAYKNKDYDTLETILEIVDPDFENLYREKSTEDKQEIIERLKRSIQEEKKKIRKVESSFHANVADFYDSDDVMKKLRARRSLSDLLFSTIEEKTSRLKELKDSDII